jgi:hypothetical protein
MSKCLGNWRRAPKAQQQSCSQLLPRYLDQNHVIASLVPNEVVVVRAGGVLLTGFLKEIGIQVETRHGT